MRKKRNKPTTRWGKIWHFIWYEDSLASWAANIILAFLIIKFLLYPFLSLVLGTSLPLVAVVSESMDHGYTKIECKQEYRLCGETITKDQRVTFDEYWDTCNEWYDNNNITKETFLTFPLKNGFSKGDIILLTGKKPANIAIGDIIVFQSQKAYPIIHRVTKKEVRNGKYFFQTKGDHNKEQIRPPFDNTLDETNIPEEHIIGVARAKIPLLGWIKVGLVDLFTKKAC